METEEKVEEETKGGKLKSRKFWITAAVAAYFAVMAIKEQGMDSLAAQIIYIVGIIIVVAVYVIIQGRITSDKIIEGSTDEEEQG
ncbi:MAG: hypothetical protein LUD72_11370 [Bacteroidales bacterium]|nr:hypothetical protein [Bacteroidales bacterium]